VVSLFVCLFIVAHFACLDPLFPLCSCASQEVVIGIIREKHMSTIKPHWMFDIDDMVAS
jgi:hypothetical protein